MSRTGRSSSTSNTSILAANRLTSIRRARAEQLDATLTTKETRAYHHPAGLGRSGSRRRSVDDARNRPRRSSRLPKETRGSGTKSARRLDPERLQDESPYCGRDWTLEHQPSRLQPSPAQPPKLTIFGIRRGTGRTALSLIPIPLVCRVYTDSERAPSRRLTIPMVRSASTIAGGESHQHSTSSEARPRPS
jgi:hypothetical protein